MKLKTTPLHQNHLGLNAKMGAFAGYDMPLSYAEGTLAEHLWTREKAGLFDVSHMGQFMIEGPDALAFMARMTPSDFSTLKDNRARYTVLTNAAGGIVDDLIVTRLAPDRLFVVVNAGTKDKDFAWLESHLPQGISLTRLEDRGLIALQGPRAEHILMDTVKLDMQVLPYMGFTTATLPCGREIFVSRLGYTGEDGFELSLPQALTAPVWDKLLTHPDARPIGLAARDTLRLEMGYPLYGHDIDDMTSPVEAGLSWVIARSNRDFIGARVILDHLENGPPRSRIALRLTQPGIAREGSEITSRDGRPLGTLTSGGFSPSLKQAIGMGYIPTGTGQAGDALSIAVRGRPIAAEIATLPFMPPKTRTKLKS